MNTQRFQELKRLLTQGKDFGKVLTFFFDHIGEARELPAVSQPVQRPIVEAAVQAAVQQMTGQAELAQFLLLSVDRHHFLHGGFLVKGRVGTVLYFEDFRAGHPRTFCSANTMFQASNSLMTRVHCLNHGLER